MRLLYLLEEPAFAGALPQTRSTTSGQPNTNNFGLDGNGRSRRYLLVHRGFGEGPLTTPSRLSAQVSSVRLHPLEGGYLNANAFNDMALLPC